MVRTIHGRYTAVIIAIVTLFLAVLLGINYLQLKSHSIATASETTNLLLDHADRQFDILFSEIQAIVESLSRQRSVRSVDVEAMRDQFIAEVLSRSEHVRAIYLGTASGEMHEWGHGPGFVDYTPTFPEDYDPRVRPWYQAALEADGYTITDPYVYASVEALGITAVKPVYHDDGELVGVLGLDLILDGLQRLVESLKIQKGGRLMLLDRERHLLVDQFDPGNEIRLELPLFPFPDLLAPGKERTVMMDGIRYLVEHTVNGSTGWILMLFVPYDNILEFSQENLKLILFYDLLLMILLASVVTMISRRLLTRPVQQIISVLSRLEQGDTAARIPPQSGDEFMLIGRLFNQLADANLAYSRKMEDQVQQRTADVIHLQKENMRLRIIEEKERIYANLHDSLGARLTGINISNNVARQALKRSEWDLLSQMHERIESNTAQGIEDLKEILQAWQTRVFSSAQFSELLAHQLKERLALKQIELDLLLPAPEALDQLDGALLDELRYIMQEMVTNTLKHSSARHASLTVALRPERLNLIYSDDGVGFDMKDSAGHGMGIRGIYHRAERIGGRLKVSARHGRGVRYELTVRLEEKP